MSAAEGQLSNNARRVSRALKLGRTAHQLSWCANQREVEL